MANLILDGTTSIVAVRPAVYEMLNISKGTTAAAGTYGTYDNDPRYKAEHVRQEIYDAVRMCIKTICETEGHPHRHLYIATQFNDGASSLGLRLVSLATLGNLGTPTVISIKDSANVVRVGKPAPAAKLDEWVNHPDSDVTGAAQGYYDFFQQDQIYYYGKTLYIDFVALPSLGDTDLKLPEEYRDVVVAICLGHLYGKQADELEAAQYYLQTAGAYLQGIMKKQVLIPPIQAFQSSR